LVPTKINIINRDIFTGQDSKIFKKKHPERFESFHFRFPYTENSALC